MAYYERHIFFCCNQREGTDRPSCDAKGASEMRDYAKQCVKKLGLAHIQLGLLELAMADDKRRYQELGLLKNSGLTITAGMIGLRISNPAARNTLP